MVRADTNQGEAQTMERGKINEIAEAEHCHFQRAAVFCKGSAGDIAFSVFKTDNISVGSALWR